MANRLRAEDIRSYMTPRIQGCSTAAADARYDNIHNLGDGHERLPDGLQRPSALFCLVLSYPRRCGQEREHQTEQILPVLVRRCSSTSVPVCSRVIRS